jgi:hypothetical protein
VKVILVRPAYDDVSQTMNLWARRAKVGIYTEYDLDGFSVSEENLRRGLQAFPNAHLVAFYGHGEPDSLVVKNRDGVQSPLIHVTGPGVIPQELAGRNLYAVACHSGSNLGPALAAVACSFVGYEKDLTIVPDFEREFGDVVNRCLVAWATETRTSAQIGEQLSRDWLQLSDNLSGSEGGKSLWLAVLAAFWNGHRVIAY